MLLSFFKIIGHSMEPTIKNGGFVLISSISYFFVKPQIKDIIAFKKQQEIIIKRIAKIDGEKYFVKGDNNKDSLEIGWINRREIIGKVIFNLSS